MTLQQYQVETTRTFPNLGSLVTDSIHMTAGMVTEIQESMHTDENEIEDEYGDVLWYVSNYSNLHNLPLIFDIGVDEEIPFSPIELAMMSAVRLLDFDKKKLAYGKEYDSKKQSYYLSLVFSYIIFDLENRGFDLSEVYEKNIQKLRVRFPEKFSGEQAINKNVEKEKEVFN
jgi:NTP pyrophosphatase (non-canonical NTP hydrolase)